MIKPKLIRITTVPLSLDKLLSGQLHYMNSEYEVIAVSSEKEYLERVGKKEGVRTHCVEMSRKITPIKDCVAVLKLYRFFRNEKPLIVHTHTPKAGIIGMLASKLAGVPNRFHTVAGLPLLETTGITRKVLNFVEKLTYACATKIYPNSFGLQEIILKNNFCKSSKLKVLANGSSNGIDTSYFNPELYEEEFKNDLRRRLGINSEDFVFVFVGRLVADKGINEMIEAFELLQQKHSKVKLLLVGSFEEELDPLLPETLRKIKENNSIITVGFQSDVRAYLAISEVLVFPSYREGFPNVVMQAGAMGLPCIVSNINGCNEIIIDGENGVIISVKDVEAVFNKMKLFIEDYNFYLKLKSNTRHLIVSRFEHILVCNAIKEEYKESVF